MPRNFNFNFAPSGGRRRRGTHARAVCLIRVMRVIMLEPSVSLSLKSANLSV
jgi:hypothetical protein